MNETLEMIRVFENDSSSLIDSSSKDDSNSKNDSGVSRSLIRIFRVVYARICAVEMRMF